MRRVLGVVLTGLGAFFLVLALLFRFYLPSQVIKFPLNEYSVSDLTGTNVTYFSDQTLAEVTGATVRAASTVQGDVAAGSSSTAVWNDVTGVFDITSGPSPGTPIAYSSERIAFDRRSGLVVNCCGAEIGTKKVKMSGQEFVWPIGTQKKNYQIFDTTLLKPETVKFTGTSTVNGMNVDVFVEHVDSQQFKTVSLPGSLVGLKSQSTVTLPEDLTATNTFYVDPASGSPLKLVENQTEFLRNPSTGATALTLLRGTLTTAPKSIAAAVSTAKSSDTEIAWVQDIGPLIGGLLGLLLLVLGIVLLLGQYEEYYEYEEEGAELPAGA
jgi:Porin PorA